MAKLPELASVLRSKNAGPFQVTLDLLFDNAASYHRVLDSGVLSPERVAALYGVPSTAVDVIPFEMALAIKVTLPRHRSSGSPGDTDVYGAQQHALLLTLDVPD